MKKVGNVYGSLQEVKVKVETESAEDEIQRECQVLWETLCEADPEKNMFNSNAYKKFMVGCAAKLERMQPAVKNRVIRKAALVCQPEQ